MPPADVKYGEFFPQIGVWVFNPAVGKDLFFGLEAKQATASVHYNAAPRQHNGLFPNGEDRSDKEYNNALKFVNVLKNVGSDKCIENLAYQNEETLIYCVARIMTDVNLLNISA